MSNIETLKLILHELLKPTNLALFAYAAVFFDAARRGLGTKRTVKNTLPPFTIIVLAAAVASYFKPEAVSEVNLFWSALAWATVGLVIGAVWRMMRGLSVGREEGA